MHLHSSLYYSINNANQNTFIRKIFNIAFHRTQNERAKTLERRTKNENDRKTNLK